MASGTGSREGCRLVLDAAGHARIGAGEGSIPLQWRAKVRSLHAMSPIRVRYRGSWGITRVRFNSREMHGLAEAAR